MGYRPRDGKETNTLSGYLLTSIQTARMYTHMYTNTHVHAH